MKRTKVKCLYVATYKGDEMSYVSKPVIAADPIMQVPVKQACLLAMDTLRRVVMLSAERNPPMYILTPLAGAVFSRNDIAHISAILNVDAGATVCMLNDSCQSGGHNLPNSNGTIAVLATVANTRRLAESGKTQEAGSIITKVTKQYIAKKGVMPLMCKFSKEWLHMQMVVSHSVLMLRHWQKCSMQLKSTQLGL